MKFTLKPSAWNAIDADVLVLYCFENQLPQFLTKDRQLATFITEAAKRELFAAREGEMLSVSTKGYIASFRLLFVGLGKMESADLYTVRVMVAKSVRKAREFKPAKVAIVPNETWMQKYEISQLIQALAEAASLSLYDFRKYKNREDPSPVRDIEEFVISIPASKMSAAEEGISTAQITTKSTYFARDLVNEPSIVTTPSYLASIATSIAQDSGGKVKVEVLEKERLEKLGMGAYLSVAKGSDEPPKFIILSYRPIRAQHKVALVGKGVTFDTGGLSLKSSEHMEAMKMDMSGAATVLAVFKALIHYPVSHHVVGIIPACENMPSGRALKPGDIVKTMSGKTIEVLNTDAEGRLTLADAFSYIREKEKPDYMIDLATLTGACMIALGQEIAGLWSSDAQVLHQLQSAADAAGEKVWPMPLEQEYKELIKSDIADVKNIQTGRYGGAITAALFLKEFVWDTCKWAHLDIAGPAFEEKDTPLVPKGGAGFGVRLLLHFLKNL